MLTVVGNPVGVKSGLYTHACCTYWNCLEFRVFDPQVVLHFCVTATCPVVKLVYQRECVCNVGGSRVCVITLIQRRVL